EFELVVWSTKRRRRKFWPFSETGATTTHLEHVLNLLGEDALAGLTFAPARIVEFYSSSSCPNSLQHFRLSLREMFVEPMLEQWRDRPWQTQQNMAGELRAGFGAGRDDRRNFVIVNARDHGRNHYADGNLCGSQLRDSIQTRSRGRCSRLEYALEFWIQGRDRKVHHHSIMSRQLG